MQEGSKQRCLGFSCGEGVMNMTALTRTTGGNDGNLHLFGNSARQLQVIASLGSIGIHTRDQQFACTSLFDFFCPKDGIFPGIFPPSPHVNVPTRIRWLLAASGINGNDDTLVTEVIASLVDKLRIAYRR